MGTVIRLVLPRPRTIPEAWMFMRPYGVWICYDGSAVLFVGNYLPIIKRHRAVEVIPRWTWIDWTTQNYLVDEREANALLRSWGLPRYPTNSSSTPAPNAAWPTSMMPPKSAARR